MSEATGWKALHNLPLALFVLTMLAVALGGGVRIHDAGESCPDWPKCFGTWTFIVSEEEQTAWYEANPEEVDSRGDAHRYTTWEIFLEWAHRVITGLLLGPLCILQWWLAFRRRREMRDVHHASAAALLLVIIQGIMGMITVRYDNIHWSVAAHLLLSQALALSLLWAWLRWRAVAGESNIQVPSRHRKGLLDSAVATMVVLVLGAFVAATPGQNGACSVGTFAAWPLCNGGLFSSLTENIQYVHRIAVLLVLALLVRTLPQLDGAARTWFHAGLGFYGVNLFLGGAYILTWDDGFMESLSLMHLLLGSAAFLCIAHPLLHTFLPGADEEE